MVAGLNGAPLLSLGRASDILTMNFTFVGVFVGGCVCVLCVCVCVCIVLYVCVRLRAYLYARVCTVCESVYVYMLP